MRINTRFPVAVHMLALIELNKTQPSTSELMALSVGTNPVVIRQLMSSLKRAGLIETQNGVPGCHLAGRFVPAGDLPGTTKSASAAGNLFSRQSGIFAGRCEALREACRKLGGIPGTVGDVSIIIPVFDFLPAMLQFWDADEEFDAVLKFMWDYNTTDFMHFETMAFATMHLIDRLKEIVEGFE